MSIFLVEEEGHLPELDEALVEHDGQVVARQVVALAGQQQHAVPGLGPELEPQRDALVGGAQRREGQPATAREARVAQRHLCNGQKRIFNFKKKVDRRLLLPLKNIKN